MRRFMIGVDESGTGAWSGPFTVCAAVSDEETDRVLVESGIKDSKKLSDKKRRELFPEIADLLYAATCEVVGVEEIASYGQKKAWVRALKRAALSALKKTPVVSSAEVTLMVDGPLGPALRRELSQHFSYVRAENQADNNYASVGAASIVAKTIRNDAMLLLHDQYPEYGWNNNYGYGTKEHLSAIRRHGLTEHHRPIRTLEGEKRRQ